MLNTSILHKFFNNSYEYSMSLRNVYLLSNEAHIQFDLITHGLSYRVLIRNKFYIYLIFRENKINFIQLEQIFVFSEYNKNNNT